MLTRAVALLDEQHALTAMREINGERQTNRPTPHNQYWNICTHGYIMCHEQVT